MRASVASGCIAVCLLLGALAQSQPSPNRLIELFKQHQIPFGLFVADKSEAGGTALAKDSRIDFAFFDMEHGGLNLPQLTSFLKGLREAHGNQAVLVRIPELHNTDRAVARKAIADLLALNIDGIIFPETQSKEEAEFGLAQLRASGRGLWPSDADPRLIAYFMVEDRNGLSALSDIAALPGVAILSGGQSTLTQTFHGDKQAVEAALQTILKVAKEHQIACAKLVSGDELESRLSQGFRVITLNGRSVSDLLDRGRKAAGR